MEWSYLGFQESRNNFRKGPSHCLVYPGEEIPCPGDERWSRVCFSKRGSGIRSISITWELASNAKVSPAPHELSQDLHTHKTSQAVLTYLKSLEALGYSAECSFILTTTMTLNRQSQKQPYSSNQVRWYFSRNCHQIFPGWLEFGPLRFCLLQIKAKQLTPYLLLKFLSGALMRYLLLKHCHNVWAILSLHCTFKYLNSNKRITCVRCRRNLHFSEFVLLRFQPFNCVWKCFSL